MSLSSSLSRYLPLTALLCLFFSGLNLVAANSVEDSATAERTVAPTSASMLMTMASEARTNNDEAGALRFYRRVIRERSTSIHAPEAHFQSALIRLNRKQWSKAFDHLQSIVASYPDYPGFSEVIRQQYAIAEALRQGARLRLFGRVPGLRSPERAVKYFEQVVENAPFHEVAPSALLKAANLQVDRKQLDEAIDLYDRFISDYRDHPQVSDAYFGLAEAFAIRVRGPAYDQGASREAISYYEDFLLLNPRHPRAQEAEERIEEMRDVLAQSRVVLGDFYFYRRSNFPAARVFYNEAISISPVSSTADEAREKLAEVERRAARAN